MIAMLIAHPIKYHTQYLQSSFTFPLLSSRVLPYAVILYRITLFVNSILRFFLDFFTVCCYYIARQEVILCLLAAESGLSVLRLA